MKSVTIQLTIYSTKIPISAVTYKVFIYAGLDSIKGDSKPSRVQRCVTDSFLENRLCRVFPRLIVSSFFSEQAYRRTAMFDFSFRKLVGVSSRLSNLSDARNLNFYKFANMLLRELGASALKRLVRAGLSCFLDHFWKGQVFVLRSLSDIELCDSFEKTMTESLYNSIKIKRMRSNLELCELSSAWPLMRILV